MNEIVVSDASVLINFIRLERLDLMARLVGWRFIVPEEVLAEITDPDQRIVVEAALTAGGLGRDSVNTPTENAAYAELRAVMGQGEAACLAMAQARGWLVACDEKRRFLWEATARLGSDRIVNTPGMLLKAIRDGIITVEKADRLKDALATHRFRVSFASFGDLL